jgi:hypothetical protein
VERGFSDDTIVFAPTPSSGLVRVPASGGTPIAATVLEPGEGSHRWPLALPGGRGIVFANGPPITGSNWNEAHIVAQSLTTGERRQIVPRGTFPRFVAPGLLLYEEAGELRAIRFDPDRLQPSGAPMSISEVVRQSGAGGADIDVSLTGTLVATGSTAMEDRLGWVDRTGRFEPLPMSSALSYVHPRISPDGTRRAYVAAGSETDVWVRDLAAGTATRLTSEGVNLWPVWTRDGQRLAYASSRGRGASIFWRRADAGEPEELLLKSETIVGPRSWSNDDRTLLFVASSVTASSEIWSLSLSGRKTAPFLRTKFATLEPSISPNGRWMAYVSNECGRPEVYVRDFVEPATRWQVSVDGGEEPAWGHAGRELFFRRGVDMVAVEVRDTATFGHGPTRTVFSVPFKRDGVNTNYDLDRNDQRFVMVKSAVAPDSALRTTVTLNWNPLTR